MKRLYITLFLLGCFVASLFAVTTEDSVSIISTVTSHTYNQPVFSLIGFDIFGTQLDGNKTINLRQNITKDDIELTFSIIQMNLSKFVGTIYLDIDATPFISDNTSSKEPIISSINMLESLIDVTYADKRFVLNYLSDTSVASFNVSSFKIVWKADTTLPQDFYKASVSLTCTIL